MEVPSDMAVREFLYTLVNWSNTQSILDIGCGKGYDLQRMAVLASTTTRLTGIDRSESNIRSARTTAGGGEQLTFEEADLSDGIPFADQTFDTVFSKNVIECITDKQKHLRDVHRVLRPGGQVICAHYDWDSIVLDGSDKDLVRRIIHAFGDWKQAWMTDSDAWMGRRLWQTFAASGLFRGKIQTTVLIETDFSPGTYGWDMINGLSALVRLGTVSEQEFARFRSDIEQLAAHGKYLFGITMFVYIGQSK